MQDKRQMSAPSPNYANRATTVISTVPPSWARSTEVQISSSQWTMATWMGFWPRGSRLSEFACCALSIRTRQKGQTWRIRITDHRQILPAREQKSKRLCQGLSSGLKTVSTARLGHYARTGKKEELWVARCVSAELDSSSSFCHCLYLCLHYDSLAVAAA